MKIKVHNSELDGNESTSNVKVKTNLWILPHHHICLTFNILAHIIGDGTRRSPLLCCYEKGWIRAPEQKGCDLPLSKSKAGEKVGAWMSGMLPDTG